MGIFNNNEKKVIAALCKKSEDIGNDISKEINEFLDDLKEEYEQNKIVLKEFNSFVSELQTKISPEDAEKLNYFSTRLYKVKRCAKKGVEAMRELARDQKKATRETIREYQEYLHV
jgi:type I site-specific restriction endonuclease